MTLPEPNFIERDPDKITQEWVDYYEARTGKTIAPAQVERILIDLGAYRETLLRIQIQETAKQNLVNYATYPILDFLGLLEGVERIPAQSAKTTVRFTVLEILDFDLIISNNIQLESKDGKVTFQAIESKELKAGESFVDIKVAAVEAGESGNGYLAGEVNKLITPLPYIGSVENLDTSAGGADEENDDQLRERIKQAPEQFSNAGCKGAYKFHALSSHPDIIDVSVLSPSAGVVQIYPLTKTGNPNSEILSTVEDYIMQDKIKALTDFIEVNSPQKIDFSISVTLTLYDFADKDSVVEQSRITLEDYSASLRKKLGKDIIKTQIISALNSIYGVYKVVVNGPSETILEPTQWGNCTLINIEIGGYISE